MWVSKKDHKKDQELFQAIVEMLANDADCLRKYTQLQIVVDKSAAARIKSALADNERMRSEILESKLGVSLRRIG